MFRRFKSGGDEPGTKDEIVIKIDPVVRKSAPARSGKGGAPAKSVPSGKSAPAAKSGAAAKSGKSDRPGKSGKSRSSAVKWTPIEPDDDFDEEFEEEEAEGDDTRTAAQRRADLEAELQRQAEEFGLTGNNPEFLYGPNGEAVAELIDSLPEIDDETAEEIADAFDAVPEAERKVARTVIRRRHRGGKLEGEIATAERAVADWFSSLMLTDEDEDLYMIVAEAATDAVIALVLEEDLDQADFDTLYGPWSEVMDVDEDDEDDEDEAPAGTDAPTGSSASAKSAKSAKSVEDADEDGEEQGEFGPNTALVIELIAKLVELDGGQIAELVAAWREGPKEELRVAHRALQDLADEDETWREQLHLAQDEVFAWMEGRTSKLHDRAFAADEDLRVRETAGPAAADAVAALVLADILEPEEAEVLYAPWAEVVGEPALPTYEDEES